MSQTCLTDVRRHQIHHPLGPSPHFHPAPRARRHHAFLEGTPERHHDQRTTGREAGSSVRTGDITPDAVGLSTFHGLEGSCTSMACCGSATQRMFTVGWALRGGVRSWKVEVCSTLEPNHSRIGTRKDEREVTLV